MLKCHIGGTEGWADCYNIKRQRGVVDSTWTWELDRPTWNQFLALPTCQLSDWADCLPLGALLSSFLKRALTPSGRVVRSIWSPAQSLAQPNAWLLGISPMFPRICKNHGGRRCLRDHPLQTRHVWSTTQAQM